MMNNCFLKPQYEEAYYYTLTELLDNGNWNGTPSIYNVINTFYTIGSDFNYNMGFPSTALQANGLLFRLWENIKLRYGEHFIIKTFEEISKINNQYQIITYKPMKLWVYKLLNMFSMTYDKYATIINLYETKKTNLMDKIKSTTKLEIDTNHKSKLNDTPQNAGNFEAESYTSEFRQETADDEHETSYETDADTIMARIKEIDDSYRKVMYEWINEFEQLFYEKEED